MKPQSRTKRFFKSIEKFFSRFKQKYVVYYLLEKSGGREVITRYRQQPSSTSEVPIGTDAPVWLCWWQGEEHMPDIAKACLHSIRTHTSGHPVILITKDNYRNYADVPEFILKKQQQGLIDLTHFSDILRCLLLTQHGGIWMDCTVLLPSYSLNDFISPSAKFWSCHHRPIYHNISKGGWTSFFWACGKGNLLPSVLSDLHLCYWQKHNRLVNYLLLDYTFAIARAGLSKVSQMVEEVPLTEMGPLGKCLNEEYTPEQWEHFCQHYHFHKLSYKTSLHKYTPDGKLTFWGHIIENFFPTEPNETIEMK